MRLQPRVKSFFILRGDRIGLLIALLVLALSSQISPAQSPRHQENDAAPPHAPENAASALRRSGTNAGLKPGGTPATLAVPGTTARLVETSGRLPLAFEENRGQTDAQVKFLARGKGYTLFLTRDEAVLRLRTENQRAKGKSRRAKLEGLPAPSTQHRVPSVLRLRLAGANPNPRVEGLEELAGKVNYFLGNDPAKWRTNVPTYAQVRYQDVWPGIDLVYYGKESGVRRQKPERPDSESAGRNWNLTSW